MSVFELLKRATTRDQLGHGLLLVSPSLSSVGFEKLLRDFVGFLMCSSRVQEPVPVACGRCESCIAFKDSEATEGVHPDLFRLRSDSKSGYSVDQIKELRSSLGLARSLAAERVIILENAEELGGGGGAAANALLKLLEEPRPNTRLLLMSERPEGILATIRSRCQLFRIPLPSGETQASALDSEALERWQPLWNWLEKGFAMRDWPFLGLPPDEDSFFKERERATEELRAVFWEAWMRSRSVLANLELDNARESLRWFDAFQELLSSFRYHGQGALQWSAFKSRARVLGA
jgi:DNA polymerase III subunit delta'